MNHKTTSPHHDAWVMRKLAKCKAKPTHHDYKVPRAITSTFASIQVAHVANIMGQLVALSIDL